MQREKGNMNGFWGHGTNGTQSLLRNSGTERGAIAHCLQVVPCGGIGVLGWHAFRLSGAVAGVAPPGVGVRPGERRAGCQLMYCFVVGW